MTGGPDIRTPPAPAGAAGRPGRAFGELAHTPAEHFRLAFYATIAALRGKLAGEGVETEGGDLGFLAPYFDQLAAVDGAGSPGPESCARWWAAVRDWERSGAGHLPLRALREAGDLGDPGLTLLLTVDLAEEDARFGALFEALGGDGTGRPTAGLLERWFGAAARPRARAALNGLLELGAIEVTNPGAPRSGWALAVPAAIGAALRGESPGRSAPWLRHVEAARQARLGDMVLPREVAAAAERLTGAIAGGEVATVIVRGPRHGGRRTLIGAIARSLGRGLLAVDAGEPLAPERWTALGALATLLHAVPAVALEPGPGEAAAIPAGAGGDGPLAVTLPRHGGADGPGAEGAAAIELEVPAATDRRLHWRAALGGGDGLPDLLAERYRTTGGNIRRAASLAMAEAALAGRPHPDRGDVRRAMRTLSGEALDRLAARIEVDGSWADLAVAEETMEELLLLERRCRERERLRDGSSGPAAARPGLGVRALLSGPSGTGKTLAARLLASALEKDLYQLDLSAVVSKYVGETEKQLEAVFSRAEELDVVLLVNEGDSLLGARTEIRSSHDRFANQESNFALQRLESFDGTLIVTTNAAERIDRAFERRMDVAVEFRPPGPAERRAIWALHLPADHAVDGELVEEAANRCALSGGRIRNAAHHAALLALAHGGQIESTDLEAAIRREYRKAGGVCPLRRRS